MEKLKWDGELIFTSGASEAAQIALSRGAANARFVSAVEHDAVLAAALGAPKLAVTPDGAVDEEAMVAVLAKAHNPLVAIQSLNSETGNWQNHGDLTDRIHEAGGLVLVDCAQSAGKYPLQHEIDMAIISGHKFGGPVGIGALLVREYAMLAPDGGQERGYRRGTENLPGALGMLAALEAWDMPWKGRGGLPQDVFDAVESFAKQVRAGGGTWFSDRLDGASAYIHALAMPGVSAAAQLMRFDMARIAVSQGSACSSGSMRRSAVLTAMGVADELADRTIRMSLGWSSTVADIERFAEVWLAMAAQGRAAA